MLIIIINDSYNNNNNNVTEAALTVIHSLRSCSKKYFYDLQMNVKCLNLWSA